MPILAPELGYQVLLGLGALALVVAVASPRAALPLALCSLAVRPELFIGGMAISPEWGVQQTLLAGALAGSAVRFGVRREVNWPIIALVVVFALSLLLGDLHPELTIPGMIAALAVLCLPWLFTQVVLPPGSRRVCALVLALLPSLDILCAVVIQAPELVFGLFHAPGYGGYRLYGAAGDAGSLALLAFCGFAVGLHESTRPGRPWAPVLGAINLCILMLTVSRMGILASLSLTAAYAAWSRPFREQLLGRKRLMILAGVLVLAAFATMLPTMLDRLTSDQYAILASGRNLAWPFYYEEFLLSPIFGRGFGSGFVEGISQMRRQSPHNEYLHLMVIGGVTGLVLCLLGIGAWFRQLLSHAAPNDREFLPALILAIAMLAVVEDVLTLPGGVALWIYAATTLTAGDRAAVGRTWWRPGQDEPTGRGPEPSFGAAEATLLEPTARVDSVGRSRPAVGGGGGGGRSMAVVRASAGQIFDGWLVALAVAVSGLAVGRFMTIAGVGEIGATTVWLVLLFLMATRLLQVRGLAWPSVMREHPALCCLVLLALVSVTWSEYPSISLQRWGALAVTTLMGVSMALLLPPRALITALTWGLILPIGVGLVLYLSVADPTAYWVADADEHLRGFAATKNGFGPYVACAAILVAALTIKSEIPRLIGVALIAMCAIAAFSAESKTSMLAAIAGTGAIAGVTLARRLNLYLPAVLSLIGLGTVAVVASTIYFADELTGLIDRNATLTGRTDLWAMTGDMIMHQPLLGFGYWAIWDLPETSGLLSAFSREEGWSGRVVHAHNGWVQIASDLGVPAAIAALIYVLAIARRAIKAFHDDGSALSLFAVGFVVGFVVMNVGEPLLLRARSGMWMVFVALAVALAREVWIQAPAPAGNHGETTMETAELRQRLRATLVGRHGAETP